MIFILLYVIMTGVELFFAHYRLDKLEERVDALEKSAKATPNA